MSIPQRYDSFLSPIMSPKLWSSVDSQKTPTAFEMPYVVRMQNVFVAAEEKLCFTFEHPKTDPGQSNDRFIRLRWRISTDCTIHGLAGYFDSKLYANVHISIAPHSYSTGMFSWYPVYFPFARPIEVAAGQDIEVVMWRRGTASRVWYEWALTHPAVGGIHNPNGRSYGVGL